MITNLAVSELTEGTEAKEPAFLRRLRGAQGDGDPSRHQNSLTRPKKHKMTDEEEDEPTYFDVDGQTSISKAEYDALVNQRELEKCEEKSPPSTNPQSHLPEDHVAATTDPLEGALLFKQLEASIGRTSKKRAGKVFGDNAGEVNAAIEGADSSLIGSIKVSKPSMKMKNPKKVKLSFDE